MENDTLLSIKTFILSVTNIDVSSGEQGAWIFPGFSYMVQISS